MGRYDGKRVLITGGAGGLGLATAALLAGEGATVIVTARGEAGLARVRDALGDKAQGIVSDATAMADIEALAATIERDHGTIDALLICAGQTRFVSFADTTEDIYNGLMAVNARGPFFTMQALAPLIADGGAIVVVTSVADAKGLPMIAAYAASKAALRSMVRSVAGDLVGRNVRVNAISPGAIDTGILDKTMPHAAAAEATRQMTDRNPMRRFGRSDEIARAMAFLAFEATYTTGFEFVVDGGSTQI